MHEHSLPHVPRSYVKAKIHSLKRKTQEDQILLTIKKLTKSKVIHLIFPSSK